MQARARRCGHSVSRAVAAMGAVGASQLIGAGQRAQVALLSPCRAAPSPARAGGLGIRV